MSAISLTPTPLGARVYDNLAYTYDPETRTIVWEDKAPTMLTAVMSIVPGKVSGIWWDENDRAHCTEAHSRREVIQALPTTDGKTAVIVSMLDSTPIVVEEESRFESRACQGLISVPFDPATGKPTTPPSHQSTNISRSTHTNDMGVNGDAE